MQIFDCVRVGNQPPRHVVGRSLCHDRRLLLTDAKRVALAEKGKPLGKLLADVRIVPKGRPKIAQRFNVGIRFSTNPVPKGRLSVPMSCLDFLFASRSSRSEFPGLLPRR